MRPSLMARTLREIYEFGAQVGFLPEDENLVQNLHVIEARFETASEGSRVNSCIRQNSRRTVNLSEQC